MRTALRPGMGSDAAPARCYSGSSPRGLAHPRKYTRECFCSCGPKGTDREIHPVPYEIGAENASIHDGSHTESQVNGLTFPNQRCPALTSIPVRVTKSGPPVEAREHHRSLSHKLRSLPVADVRALAEIGLIDRSGSEEATVVQHTGDVVRRVEMDVHAAANEDRHQQ